MAVEFQREIPLAALVGVLEITRQSIIETTEVGAVCSST